MSIESASSLTRTGLLVVASSLLSVSSFSANAQQILEKKYIGYGPMNDKICEVQLNTGGRVIQLCEHKPDAYRSYGELYGGGMQYEPGGYRYTPPGQIISGPRVNPRTGKIEIASPTLSRGEFGYSQGGYVYKESKLRWCTEQVKFSQKNGEPISITRNCN